MRTMLRKSLEQSWRLGAPVLGVVLGLVAAAASPAQAGTVLTGTFGTDDAQRVFAITVFTPGTLTVRTAGYGGDANLGINGGGFDPMLSLFQSGNNGLLLAVNNDGPCGRVTPAPSYNACFDAYLSLPVVAGEYWLVLTQSDNGPFGPYFADGFSRTGEPNFTAGLAGLPQGQFIDIFGQTRSSQWAVVVEGEQRIAETPEPGTWLLSGAGLLALWRRQRRKG